MGTVDLDIDLANRVIHAAEKRNVTLSTAESCTGGLVAGALTAVPGSSSVFLGGVISYANQVKEEVLGVPAAVLEEGGAVSEETARAMAQGACRVLGADLSVSVTGIAGPGGGTADKPVGLVCFGLCSQEGTGSETIRFQGDRSQVRSQAVSHALDLLLDALQRNPVGIQ